MSVDLFGSVVVPLADDGDAATTARAVAPYVEAGDRLTVVHVIEKAGGAPDKASVAQREEYAGTIFEAFETAFADAIDGRSVEAETAVDAEILYGTDVADAILDFAAGRDATAIAYTSRGLSRWVEFLTGGVDDALVDGADRPVVILPNPGD